MLRLTIWLAIGIGVFFFGIWQKLDWWMSLFLGFMALCGSKSVLDSSPPRSDKVSWWRLMRFFLIIGFMLTVLAGCATTRTNEHHQGTGLTLWNVNF